MSPTTALPATDIPLPPPTSLARFSAIAAGLAGLLFGFDTAVISGVTHALQQAFGLTAPGLGMAVSTALWGTLVGACSAGPIGDRLGSRRMLFWIGWLYVVSAVGSAQATGLVTFCLLRFAGGVAIGASSVLAPVYIAEISPPHLRGRWVALFQFGIVAGILLAYISNGLIALALVDAQAWRIKLAVAGAPALVFALAMPLIPESPRWLLARNRDAQARRAADRLGLDLAAASAHPPAQGRLAWRRHWRPITLAIAIGAFNQLSGINAILYYLNDIFASAGFSRASADVQAIAIGAANLAATLLGMTLIDRIGRKPLLIGGSLGMCATLAGVTAIYASGVGTAWLLPLLVAFIGCFAISQGTVIWAYLAEIFPTQVRARGQAVGSTTHWVLNAGISLAFPILATYTRTAPFALFATAMAAQAFAVWRWFPETRGASLEQLEERLCPAPRQGQSK